MIEYSSYSKSVLLYHTNLKWFDEKNKRNVIQESSTKWNLNSISNLKKNINVFIDLLNTCLIVLSTSWWNFKWCVSDLFYFQNKYVHLINPTIISNDIVNRTIYLSINHIELLTITLINENSLFSNVSFLKDLATKLESWTYPDVEWKDCLVVNLHLWVSWMVCQNAAHYTGTNLNACLNTTCLTFCLDNFLSAQIKKTKGRLIKPTIRQQDSWM